MKDLAALRGWLFHLQALFILQELKDIPFHELFGQQQRGDSDRPEGSVACGWPGPVPSFSRART